MVLVGVDVTMGCAVCMYGGVVLCCDRSIINYLRLRGGEWIRLRILHISSDAAIRARLFTSTNI